MRDKRKPGNEQPWLRLEGTWVSMGTGPQQPLETTVTGYWAWGTPSSIKFTMTL